MFTESANSSDASHRRSVDLCGGAVVLSLVLLGVLLVPTWFGHVEERRESELGELAQLEVEASRIRREHARLTRELDDARLRYEQAVARVPTAIDDVAFHAEIVDLATRLGVRIDDYRTGRVVDRGTHQELDVSIDGRSDYRAMCLLLEGLASSPRAGRVSLLDVDLNDAEPGSLIFQLSWRLYARGNDETTNAET